MKINSLPRDEFQKLVYECNSLSDILKKLNLYVSSGNYRPLKIRLDDENIDYSHIKLGYGANKNRKISSNKQIPLPEILIENSIYKGTVLKNRLLKDGILENKCSKCGLQPLWCEETLVLQLDHINGNSRDNRLDNLRILCPNCHTQTENYGSKNRKIGVKITQLRYCLCGAIISKRAKACKICAGINSHPTKIIWPSKEELMKMLENSNYVQVGKKLGVSDVAVRKRLK
jgi:hypothetical protein